MNCSPASLPWQSVYKLMIGAIVPRPIGWVSTLDADGRPNLAPYSFFNAVCPNPPHVLFCPGVRSRDGQPKDTLRNVRATGEFVVNIVSEPLLRAMNLTSTEFPPEVNEFEAAGLSMAPSVRVRPPRVAESPVQFECVLVQIVDLGAEPGGGSVVIGRVVHLHVRDDVLLGTDKIDPDRLQAVGRMGGSFYTRTADRIELERPRGRG